MKFTGYKYGVPTFEHPEIGLVLEDNSGAAGEPGDNAYSRAQGPASAMIAELLRLTPPGGVPLIVAELASDGWWWRPTHPPMAGPSWRDTGYRRLGHVR